MSDEEAERRERVNSETISSIEYAQEISRMQRDFVRAVEDPGFRHQQLQQAATIPLPSTSFPPTLHQYGQITPTAYPHALPSQHTTWLSPSSELNNQPAPAGYSNMLPSVNRAINYTVAREPHLVFQGFQATNALWDSNNPFQHQTSHQIRDGSLPIPPAFYQAAIQEPPQMHPTQSGQSQALTQSTPEVAPGSTFQAVATLQSANDPPSRTEHGLIVPSLPTSGEVVQGPPTGHLQGSRIDGSIIPDQAGSLSVEAVEEPLARQPPPPPVLPFICCMRAELSPRHAALVDDPQSYEEYNTHRREIKTCLEWLRQQSSITWESPAANVDPPCYIQLVEEHNYDGYFISHRVRFFYPRPEEQAGTVTDGWNELVACGTMETTQRQYLEDYVNHGKHTMLLYQCPVHTRLRYKLFYHRLREETDPLIDADGNPMEQN